MKSYNGCAVVIVAGCVALEAALGHGKPHVHIDHYRPVNVQAQTLYLAATSAAYVSGPTTMS